MPGTRRCGHRFRWRVKDLLAVVLINVSQISYRREVCTEASKEPIVTSKRMKQEKSVPDYLQVDQLD